MGAQSERDARMLRRFGGFDQETVLGTIKPGRVNQAEAETVRPFFTNTRNVASASRLQLLCAVRTGAVVRRVDWWRTIINLPSANLRSSVSYGFVPPSGVAARRRFRNGSNRSIGIGKIVVELCSAAISFSVCR